MGRLDLVSDSEQILSPAPVQLWYYTPKAPWMWRQDYTARRLTHSFTGEIETQWGPVYGNDVPRKRGDVEDDIAGALQDTHLDDEGDEEDEDNGPLPTFPDPTSVPRFINSGYASLILTLVQLVIRINLWVRGRGQSILKVAKARTTRKSETKRGRGNHTMTRKMRIMIPLRRPTQVKVSPTFTVRFLTCPFGLFFLIFSLGFMGKC